MWRNTAKISISAYQYQRGGNMAALMCNENNAISPACGEKRQLMLMASAISNESSNQLAASAAKRGQRRKRIM